MRPLNTLFERLHFVAVPWNSRTGLLTWLSASSPAIFGLLVLIIVIQHVSCLISPALQIG